MLAIKTYSGYGISTHNIENETSVKRIENLLAHAPKLKEEIHAWFEAENIKNPTVEDYVNCDEYRGWAIGVTGIIADVIREIENVQFGAYKNCNDESFLLLLPNYTWKSSEKELSLTEEAVKEIILKYVSIITNNKVSVGEQKVEEFTDNETYSM